MPTKTATFYYDVNQRILHVLVCELYDTAPKVLRNDISFCPSLEVAKTLARVSERQLGPGNVRLYTITPEQF